MKQVDFSDEHFLTKALSDDARRIDCSQFNELLLMVNKDRVEPTFFEYFFSAPGTGAVCDIEDIRAGVDRFRKIAMLRYGNFIYAYRKLSKMETKDELLKELDQYGKKPEELVKRFMERSEKVLEVEEIPRDYTFLVGYLSAGEITAEAARVLRLLNSYIALANKVIGKAWSAP